MDRKKEELFQTLRKVHKKPNSSQRDLAEDLGFSLGKLNYCLKALKGKGLIKINNFKKNKNKLSYLYLLTPKGFVEKKNLTIKFLKIKIQEYDSLLKELENENEQKK